MPGENEIKHKIVLEGEKEYKSALQDARRNLRTLKSELKAETAELGKNATEQQKAEVKAKSLKKQIAEQEKIVETCKQQLAEAKKEYGDNADVIAKYEIQLNNARTALANMRNDLTGVGQVMQTVTTETNTGVTAAKSFADAFGSIAGAAGGISDAIEGVFTGMVSTVKDAIADVWADITELAGRANEWADLAGFWNTSTTNIQKWYRAVGSSHNDFATLNNAVTRIVMADSKKIAEAANVSSESYTDQWEYAMSVLDSLAKMGYDDRLKALGEIFGEKRATGVLDLLNDWQTIRDNLGKFDTENGGVGMTEEQLSDMATLAERIDHIQQTWEAFKDSFMAGAFGKLGLDLTGNAQGMLDSLIGFMNSDNASDRDRYIEDFKQNATEFFRRLGEALTEAAAALTDVGGDLAGSDDKMVAGIGKALLSLSGALEWFANGANIDSVVSGFDTLAKFWLIGKGAQMGAKIFEIVGNIKTIQLFGGAGGAAAAGGTAAKAAGGGKLAALGSAAVKAAPFLVGAAVLLTPSGTDGDYYDEAGNLYDKNGKLLEAAGSGGPQRWDLKSNGTSKTQETGGITDSQMAAVEGFWDMWRLFSSGMAGESEYDAAWQSMTDAFSGQDALFERINSLIDALSEGEDDWTSMEDLPAEFWQKVGGQNGGKDQKATIDGQSMESLAAAVASATEAGAARGVSGITINLNINEVADAVGAHIGRDVLLPV